MSLSQKVVIITGGSAGIGAETAISFVKEGADVVIVGRNENRLEEVAEKCVKIGTKPFVIKADITKEDEALNVIQSTADKFGKIDILVNNAGIVDFGSILKGNLIESYDKVMDINLRAVISITTKAAPHIIKSKGNIINISSTMGTSVSPDCTAYSVSKAGLNHFTRLAAKELAAFGVRVNTISPGPVATDIMKHAGAPGSPDKWATITPLKKISKPQEIADMTVFLASDKANSITGAEYIIDNGLRLKF